MTNEKNTAKLPEKDWLTIDELVARWQTDPATVLHYAETGRLRLSLRFREQTGLLELPDYTERLAAGIYEFVDPNLHHLAAIGELYGHDFLPDLCPGEGFNPQLRDEAGQLFLVGFPGRQPPSISAREVVVRKKEVERFEAEYGGRDPATGRQANVDRPLQTRQRRTLLTIIAALCDHAGIDSQAKGSAQRIKKMTESIGAPIDDGTIAKLLAEIPDALETRMK